MNETRLETKKFSAVVEEVSSQPTAGKCLITEPLTSCTLIIVGASGDLTARKLIPALFELFLNNSLPNPFNIVGCSRTDLSGDDFRKKMKYACEHIPGQSPGDWQKFAENLYYRKVDYESPRSFSELAIYLRALNSEKNTGGNWIFYLAVPPSLYPKLSRMIGQAGLSREGREGNGWSRIVVEKPFGSDLDSALELDRILHTDFHEHQIFRIDHYLAKETVQNILMFRFANAIFEPIWNRSFIDYIGIIAAEQLGVEHRAGYYEQAGVLRDMFQNHMKQLLALIALEPPASFEADRVRDEKIKVFRAMKPFDVGKFDEELVLGQYGPGKIDGHHVSGYREEPGIAPDSLVPTFAMMRIFVDNWRWKGVPFYLVSGKRLARKVTKLVVQFKEVPHSLFQNVLGKHIIANRLTFGVYPEEEITLTFQTKSPGARVCLRTVTMDFTYKQGFEGPALEAYAKVLLDCILGDHMLFWRQDGVEQSWSFLSPILEECETCGNRGERLHPYASGSWGPKRAEKWMQLIL